MINHFNRAAQPAVTDLEQAPGASPAEISAVALLTLLLRVEAVNEGKAAESERPVPLSPSAARAESLPINDQCQAGLAPSAYLQEQFRLATAAVFSRKNAEFFRAYKGVAAGSVVEIVLEEKDLRPLAYRALMYEGGEGAKPFARRFASSLLLLQKYWHCDFFQPYKDVAGRLSARSIYRAGKGSLSRF